LQAGLIAVHGSTRGIEHYVAPSDISRLKALLRSSDGGR
jgi:hypothetical protein